MHDFIGQQLGQYEIKRHIAKGGMASVYLARQASMNRDVAIKVLPQEIASDQDSRQRFYLEVEVIAGLQHPHILPVYDFGVYQDLPYIVMAYLSGGTLADRMTDGMLSIEETLRITEQVAAALDFAHQKGIIHRDFKPGNVLLDEQGNAYLADFGLAKLANKDSRLTQANVVGTPIYMAPEQASGEPPVNHTSDIYALGVTVFEMLTGKIPYEGSTAASILISHIMDPIPDIVCVREDLPETTQAIIEKVLAKSQEERYQSTGDLLNDLKVVFQGGGANGEMLASYHPQPALIMTNMLGHVIFIDNQGLNLLKRHHHEARSIIGKPIAIVLGIPPDVAQQLLVTVKRDNQIEGVELAITNSRGSQTTVTVGAMVTLDEKGVFVGADFSLTALPKDASQPPSSEFATARLHVNTQQTSYLQTYFCAQLEALYNLSANWGGHKVAANFENMVNETGRRNVWAVSMENGKLTVNLKQDDVDMYQAMLARAMDYAAHLIGKRQVIKELEHVDKQTDPSVLSFIKGMGINGLYKEILS